MKTITWKLYLKSGSPVVFDLFTTPAGIKKFWAEKANYIDNKIQFSFPNGQTYIGQIKKSKLHREFELDYFSSLVKFHLEPSEDGGTDLTLINENVAESDFYEVKAGWVSVLMNLKAVADYQCDLRNHDPNKTWDQGYVEN